MIAASIRKPSGKVGLGGATPAGDDPDRSRNRWPAPDGKLQKLEQQALPSGQDEERIIRKMCEQVKSYGLTTFLTPFLALRCIHASQRNVEFWKYCLNQRAKRNDALTLSA